MRALLLIFLTLCFCIISLLAIAHEGHQQQAPTVVAALPGGKADGITLISLTSDPLRDTPAVLKACTLKQGADDPHWFFLTGDKA